VAALTAAPSNVSSPQMPHIYPNLHLTRT